MFQSKNLWGNASYIVTPREQRVTLYPAGKQDQGAINALKRGSRRRNPCPTTLSSINMQWAS